MDAAAMNSSVQHPIARARGPELALCDAILIKLMQNPQVTFASMQGNAGVLRLLKRLMKLEISVVSCWSCKSSKSHQWINYRVIWKEGEGQGDFFNTPAHLQRNTVSDVCAKAYLVSCNQAFHSVKCVWWVTESMRSIGIVDDPGFQHLMKMGRPHYHIPSSQTVAHNVHVVFKWVKDQIIKMLWISFCELRFTNNWHTCPRNMMVISILQLMRGHHQIPNPS